MSASTSPVAMVVKESREGRGGMEGDRQAGEGNWMMSACSGLNRGGGGEER